MMKDIKNPVTVGRRLGGQLTINIPERELAEGFVLDHGGTYLYFHNEYRVEIERKDVKLIGGEETNMLMALEKVREYHYELLLSDGYVVINLNRPETRDLVNMLLELIDEGMYIAGRKNVEAPYPKMFYEVGADIEYDDW